MKKTKVIIPALGLLVLSTAASISGTVAWFSLNTKVSMSGMSVTTQVSSNLMIAASTAGTSSAGEAAFSSSATQAASGILEPASTINGVDFFYTTNGKADGDAATDAYTQYTGNTAQADFATAYGLNGNATVFPYVDYVFELKAINSANAAKYVDLTKLDLVYAGEEDGQKAFRAAIFVQEGTYNNETDVFTGTYNAMGATANCIMDVTGALNQTADTAVASTSALGSITIMAGANSNSISIAAGKTRYFKITQRIYLEGEDKTCTNETFVSLTNAWNVFTQYSLDDSNSSITEISKFVSHSVSIAAVSNSAINVYYDGSNLYNCDGLVQLSNGLNLTVATTNEELTALNTETGLTFVAQA